MSATSRVVSRDGTTIAYLTFGTGPSVLVVPGVLSTASDYATFAEALARRGFAVHVIERRGRGESGPQGPDYGMPKECEDVLAVQAATGATLLVGHSYGGLVALEAARGNHAFAKVAVYEPGVSIDGSMPTHWMPGYRDKLARGKRVGALVEFTRADAPPRIGRIPAWVMKPLVSIVCACSAGYGKMLDLLEQNLREWEEIARLDSTCGNYRDVPAGVLLMYGGRSDSRAVDKAVERLPVVFPKVETKEFPKLDHFGIERTAPQEVATAVADYFLAR